MSKSPNLPGPAFDDPKHHLRIYQGDCLDILEKIPESSVDLVFADPPYFLSNGGITCHADRSSLFLCEPLLRFYKVLCPLFHTSGTCRCSNSSKCQPILFHRKDSDSS
jgi:predicted methyltransferase